jgi:perosamine synthetase
MQSCFEKNWITEGPKAKEFTEKLLALIGAKYGVLAPNGTLALYLALRAAGIKPGDEVIVPDFTFIATANAIEMVGAIPVFVDVNRKNFQIEISSAEKFITPKTKAIMPVHVYGTIADMDEVKKIAEKHNLIIVEDAAQAIGVHYKGKHAGTFGKAAAFSFFADKTITTGEGGMIVTHDEKVYEHLLYLRNQGRKDRGTFIHPEIGYNFRMTDIQCAIGLEQLKKFEEIKKRKNTLKEKYLELLKNIPQVKIFEPEKGAEWIPFRIGIICERAHELMKFMQENEIEPRTFFYPLHLQPCFKGFTRAGERFNSEFPNAVYGYEHGVCLPTFPELTLEQVEYTCNTIKKFYVR